MIIVHSKKEAIKISKKMVTKKIWEYQAKDLEAEKKKIIIFWKNPEPFHPILRLKIRIVIEELREKEKLPEIIKVKTKDSKSPTVL